MEELLGQTLPLTFGQSMLNSEGSQSGGKSKKQHAKMHTLRYDFKPSSVSQQEPADVVIKADREVTLTVPNENGDGIVYRGSKKPPLKEFLLIVDHKSGQVTIEKVESNISVKKTRDVIKNTRPKVEETMDEDSRMESDVESVGSASLKSFDERKGKGGGGEASKAAGGVVTNRSLTNSPLSWNKPKLECESSRSGTPTPTDEIDGKARKSKVGRVSQEKVSQPRPAAVSPPRQHVKASASKKAKLEKRPPPSNLSSSGEDSDSSSSGSSSGGSSGESDSEPETRVAGPGDKGVTSFDGSRSANQKPRVSESATSSNQLANQKASSTSSVLHNDLQLSDSDSD